MDAPGKLAAQFRAIVRTRRAHVNMMRFHHDNRRTKNTVIASLGHDLAKPRTPSQ